MPLSPSMNVMPDSHEPVLPYPSSRVMYPVCARSLLMSTDGSFSVPTTTGSSTVVPSGSTSCAQSVMCPPVELPGIPRVVSHERVAADAADSPKVAVPRAAHHLFRGLVGRTP